MISYYEERRRRGLPSVLYKVQTWYFLGIPVLRFWTQLTVNGVHATSSELN